MAVNYTQEQVDFMKALYNNEPTRETVQQLANELNLYNEERKLIESWVKQGGNYAKHWAFVPPKKPSLSSKGHPIDALVQKQFPEGVGLAAAAGNATIARRLALVLTGLPPEPSLLETFLNDNRINAYERFVEQLLADPRYGEHQARYWLDAVRYGDTHGLHLDNRRGIYPYRDWVVRSLNNNLFYGFFINANMVLGCSSTIIKNPLFSILTTPSQFLEF